MFDEGLEHEVDEYLYPGFSTRSHKGWWARSDLGNEAVGGYKDGYLENVMELEEVSSILFLMFLYLAFKGRSREHSSVQADFYAHSSISLYIILFTEQIVITNGI